VSSPSGDHRDRSGTLGRIAAAGQGLCLAAAALASLALIGWFADVPSLTTLLPEHPPMMPNTAFALALLGVTGALYRRPTRARRALAWVAAVVALVIGLVTLAEYVFAVDLRIDRLFPVNASGPQPGRPSPPTALALALLGTAMLLYDSRPSARVRPSEWLALSAGLLGFTALLGQIFGTGVLYRLKGAPVIGVAVPTATGLLACSLGLLLERPDSGVMRVIASPGPGGTLLRRLGAAAVVGPVLLAIFLTRLLDVLGVDEFALMYASLTVGSTVVGLLLLALTATPLDRSHAALEATCARTQELIDQAADGIFVADPGGRCTTVNAAGCRILGYSCEELLGRRVVDLLPLECGDGPAHRRERLLAGRSESDEWSLRRKDGTDIPVEVSSRILPDGRWQAIVRDISERKRVQDQIRQSMERFDLALRGGDLAAWDWNIATGEVVFNPRWAEMRGYRPDEVRPHVDTWRSGLHPDDLARIERTLAEHFRGLTPEYEMEHRARTKSGDWIWVLDRGRVFARDADGRRTRLVGTELDFPARKRGDEALRLSEARFSGIVSVSVDAIVSIDDQQRITLFNEGAEKIFGYSREEVLGRPLDILIPARFREAHRRYVEEFATGTEVARRAGRPLVGLRKSGEEFPAEGGISRLEVGSTRILTASVRDVTEQQQRESEKELLAEVGGVLGADLDDRSILSRIAEVAVRSFADVCVVDVVDDSGELRRLTVACRDPSLAWARDLIARLPFDRGPGDSTTTVTATRRPILVPRLAPEAVASGAVDEEHLRALRAFTPQSLVAVPLTSRGNVLGALVFVSSTPSRRYGPRDLRLAEELAQRVALVLDNARLYRATQRAVQMRDEVLGIVAHDLRNPLSVVLMQAKLLLRRSAPETGSRRSAEAIERAARRMNRLIQDLLDVARVEAGYLSVETAPLSPARLVAEAVDAQRALASAAAIELRADVSADLPDITADHERLIQVFENLIGNALKFTGSGGRITVVAAPRDEREVLFQVEDTGAGIDPENLAHLFDRFWQAQEARRLGAGLGLAIVKGIVEAHGGHIWVESVPGRGTTFSFTVPTARAAGAPASARSDPRPRSKAS
jgi:PAS domain S-box-containing protein